MDRTSTLHIYSTPNPMMTAFSNLVDSYDEETNQVSWVAIRDAREVLAGRVPRHWLAESA